MGAAASALVASAAPSTGAVAAAAGGGGLGGSVKTVAQLVFLPQAEAAFVGVPSGVGAAPSSAVGARDGTCAGEGATLKVGN